MSRKRPAISEKDRKAILVELLAMLDENDAGFTMRSSELRALIRRIGGWSDTYLAVTQVLIDSDWLADENRFESDVVDIVDKIISIAGGTDEQA